MGPPSTPIPEAPTNVGVPDDPGFGNGPIWTEQIPLSAGPLSPYLIIQNAISTGVPIDVVLINFNLPINNAIAKLISLWIPYGHNSRFNTPPSLRLYRQCVQAAEEKQAREDGGNLIKEPMEGALSGGIIGCVTTAPAGCWEGAVGAAGSEFLGGLLHAIGKSIYDQLFAPPAGIAACGPKPLG